MLQLLKPVLRYLAKYIFTRFYCSMKVKFAPYKLTFTSNSTPQLSSEGIRMGYDGYDEYLPIHD